MREARTRGGGPPSTLTAILGGDFYAAKNGDFYVAVDTALEPLTFNISQMKDPSELIDVCTLSATSGYAAMPHW